MLLNKGAIKGAQKCKDGALMTDVSELIKIFRSAIGRKVIELDEFKMAAETNMDQAETYTDLVDFLERDIAGYKNILEDLKDGSVDFTGDFLTIANFNETLARIYNEVYLPSLSAEDSEAETLAMNLKSEYVTNLAFNHMADLGRNAILDQNIIDQILEVDEYAIAFGNFVSEYPPLLDLMKKS